MGLGTIAVWLGGARSALEEGVQVGDGLRSCGSETGQGKEDDRGTHDDRVIDVWCLGSMSKWTEVVWYLEGLLDG